jgi:hypothetical protein
MGMVHKEDKSALTQRQDSSLACPLEHVIER